jgi:hypothetical protein
MLTIRRKHSNLTMSHCSYFPSASSFTNRGFPSISNLTNSISKHVYACQFSKQRFFNLYQLLGIAVFFPFVSSFYQSRFSFRITYHQQWFSVFITFYHLYQILPTAVAVFHTHTHTHTHIYIYIYIYIWIFPTSVFNLYLLLRNPVFHLYQILPTSLFYF